MSLSKIVLASGNKGKVAEFTSLFAKQQVEIVAQTELGVGSVAETGTTFVENAIIKARHACQQTGLPAIADDSGIVVSALNGAPGIYSARFGGENASDSDNIDKLLSLLDGKTDRNAHFYCCLVLMRHANDPVPLICDGYWYGQIAEQRSGTDGFGYDPVFYLPSLAKTAAELAKPEKNQMSHRGQALQKLMHMMDATFA